MRLIKEGDFYKKDNFNYIFDPSFWDRAGFCSVRCVYRSGRGQYVENSS